MARPLRIEYKNAYCHVMNRGRAGRQIFHGVEYYEAFLTCLSEAHERFGVEVLCYCLMGNHYHLLIRTPEGNLTRAMRHIGGVYTLRYNRLKKQMVLYSGGVTNPFWWKKRSFCFLLSFLCGLYP